jgi:hypothetical protein
MWRSQSATERSAPMRPNTLANVLVGGTVAVLLLALAVLVVVS